MTTDEQKLEHLDGRLDMRISKTELEIFKKKSVRTTGKPHQLLLREIIKAFNDGRLTIAKTEEMKSEELYK